MRFWFWLLVFLVVSLAFVVAEILGAQWVAAHLLAGHLFWQVAVFVVAMISSNLQVRWAFGVAGDAVKAWRS